MSEGDLILESVRDLAIVRYRAARSPASTDIDLPGHGRSSFASEVEFMWRSPGVWWVKSRTKKVADIIEMLGRPDFAIDSSDAVATLAMSGELARRALSTGCPVDLRRHAFPAGAVASTRFDLFDVVLHARGDDLFDMHVAWSYAEDAQRRLAEVVARLRRNN